MTALVNMAAAARQPGLGDARVPCPLCGGLIHPVAGRCKHCKEDLTQFRAGRPQAAAALPPLVAPRAGSQPVPVPDPVQVSPWAPPAHANGAAAAPAPAPVPIAVPTAREGSQPILPQRPTGRSMAAAKPTSSLWRSWPMIVIGVAVLAIVTAVVIMVLPEDTKGPSKKIGTPPPAPERMDLDPMPPKASQLNPGDPWRQPDPGAQPQPPNPPPDPAQPDPNDPNDLFGGLGGGAGATGSAVMLTVFDKACNKLKTCPDIDQSMISTVCDQFASMPKPPPPKNCPAAQRCFDAIDGMSCSQASSSSPLTAIYLIKDCTSAMNDC